MPIYTHALCDQALDLGARGFSRAEIAKEMGVPRAQLEAWAKGHKRFAAALEEAHDLALAAWEAAPRLTLLEKDGPKLDASLYHRVMAARFPEVYTDAKGAGGETYEVPEVVRIG